MSTMPVRWLTVYPYTIAINGLSKSNALTGLAHRLDDRARAAVR